MTRITLLSTSLVAIAALAACGHHKPGKPTGPDTTGTWGTGQKDTTVEDRTGPTNDTTSTGATTQGKPTTDGH